MTSAFCLFATRQTFNGGGERKALDSRGPAEGQHPNLPLNGMGSGDPLKSALPVRVGQLR